VLGPVERPLRLIPAVRRPWFHNSNDSRGTCRGQANCSYNTRGGAAR
jgi:hypothetical protein